MIKAVAWPEHAAVAYTDLMEAGKVKRGTKYRHSRSDGFGYNNLLVRLCPFCPQRCWHRTWWAAGSSRSPSLDLLGASAA
jgi:hypothetical protein